MTEQQYDLITKRLDIPEGFIRYKTLSCMERDWNLNDILRIINDDYPYAELTFENIEMLLISEEDDEFQHYMLKAKECGSCINSPLALMKKIREEGRFQTYRAIDEEYSHYLKSCNNESSR